MYSALQLAKKFIGYYINSSNGRGHGIHSPFVFEFIQQVLTEKKNYEPYERIEKVRKQMLGKHEMLVVSDYGAGSTVSASNQRKVSVIARSALKPKKYGQLLFRMVQYYKPSTIIELGTSLGITSSYLSTGTPGGSIYTFEGATEIAAVAKSNFAQLLIQNIILVEGNFDITFEPYLKTLASVDFAFIDGNHRKQPTINYFKLLLEKVNDHSILVFDDIHWSSEMEDAWKEIQVHPAVTLTIDLFFIGIVFFRKEQKVAQHFTIRF